MTAPMPLPLSPNKRKPLHNRAINVHSFERDDGLWDLEAELIDDKSYSFDKRDGSTHPAGKPFHHMHLRITIDRSFTILDAQAVYDAAPYGENCTTIAPAYQELVGMNLLKSFRQAVKERFARTKGCSHITELAGVLPTVALQSMANERNKPECTQTDKRPFQLEGCHALRLDGPVVEEFYPHWYVAPKPASV